MTVTAPALGPGCAVAAGLLLRSRRNSAGRCHRLSLPFVPALHVPPGVADVSTERGIGFGHRPQPGRPRDRRRCAAPSSAITCVTASAPTCSTPCASEPSFATTHALQRPATPVRLQPGRSATADAARAPAGGNTAAAGVSTAVDPFLPSKRPGNRCFQRPDCATADGFPDALHASSGTGAGAAGCRGLQQPGSATLRLTCGRVPLADQP